MSGWQPIATVPRDGKIVLFANQKLMGYGCYLRGAPEDAEDAIACLTFVGGFKMQPPPTHWMPLPEPPK